MTVTGWRRRSAVAAALALVCWALLNPSTQAQERGRGRAGATGAAGGGGGRGRNSPPLPSLPITFETTEYRIRVSVVAKDLVNPWSLAFLPDGAMLVTERPGRLRIIRNGVLDPQPIAGVPEVVNTRQRGMNDVALHPHFAENHWINFTYYKPVAGTTNARATLARAHYDGGPSLSDVRDIFSTDTVVSGPYAAKIAFGPDGKIYMAIGIPIPRTENDAVSATVTDAQNPNSYYGKVLRLNDDGSAPKDNPFSRQPGHKPGPPRPSISKVKI